MADITPQNLRVTHPLLPKFGINVWAQQYILVPSYFKPNRTSYCCYPSSFGPLDRSFITLLLYCKNQSQRDHTQGITCNLQITTSHANSWVWRFLVCPHYELAIRSVRFSLFFIFCCLPCLPPRCKRWFFSRYVSRATIFCEVVNFRRVLSFPNVKCKP